MVALSFAASLITSRWTLLTPVPSGVKTIALTVVIALGAAVLFPVKDEAGVPA